MEHGTAGTGRREQLERMEERATGKRLEDAEISFGGTGCTDIVRLQFTDLCGRMKSVEVPGRRAERLFADPVSIEASALSEGIEEFLGTGGERVYLKPDWETWLSASWEPEGGAAGVICSLTDRSGNPLWIDVRETLKRTLSRLEQRGLSFRFCMGSGFFLFHTDEEGRATVITHETAGACDSGTIDLAASVRREILRGLEESKIPVAQAEHGIAPGQHFFYLGEREALRAADEFMAFRTAVRRIAKSHGLHASFMPKPLNGAARSGMEMEIIPVMEGTEEKRESVCREAVRRIEKSLGELALVTNPLVNSYRCLDGAQGEMKKRGQEGPVGCTERGIRFSLADSSANPYLAAAAVLTAGFLDGEERGEEAGHAGEAFPSTLKEAAAIFGRSGRMREMMGEKMFLCYRKRKLWEWERYCSWVSDWEVKEYLTRY